MKLAVISEVCGNLVALQAFLSESVKQKIDHTLCLGNLVGLGSHARDCLRLAMENRFIMTQGEVEFTLSRPVFAGPIEEERWALLNYAMKQLGDKGCQLLANIPLLRKVYVSDDKTQAAIIGHASLLDRSPVSVVNTTTQIFTEFELLKEYYQGVNLLCLGNNRFPIFMSSTGRFVERDCDRFGQEFHLSASHKYLINPGSIGQPAQGGNIGKDEMTYAVIEADGKIVKVTFRRCKYDVAAYVRLMRKVGIPASFIKEYE